MIKAKILADSINEDGNRLTTFEVEFPRYILSEYNTHRHFSRNAASTRAIPILKQLELIETSPAMPIYYGKNQAGMSASEELDEAAKQQCISIIDEMRVFCISKVRELQGLGLHKQHAGRYVEAWQTVKGVVSSTEWANWYWLRDHEAAQPEIADLARKMKVEYDASIPELLKAGEYHLPYVLSCYHEDEGQKFIVDDEQGTGFFVTTEQAIKVSAARCAAVSYRNEDYTLEKCLQLYDRLVGDERKHSSALEHQATPMNDYLWGGLTKEERNETNIGNIVYWKHSSEHTYTNIPSKPHTWQEGVSHTDKQGNLWSGNFKGWVQHRKTINGECYNDLQQ